MSSGKLPSALNITPPLNQQPRGQGNSILNDSILKKSDSLTHPPTPGSAGSQGYHTPNHYSYQNESTTYMNSQNNSAYGMDYGHHHHSQGQPPTPQTATSNFPPQPPILQPNYQQSNHGFPQFPFSNPNGVSSPAGQPGVSGPMGMHPTQQLLPPPQNTAMAGNHPSLGAVSNGGPQTPSSATAGYGNHSFDTTGQHAPPGMKPRVAATLWEDEGSLCFQVEARGVCVARREDNHMINGTKLLNVAGMTRGRRDGILKSEKIRHVVKIGPMHLKGVWIPFERALDFANKEKITELLYPLFVHNIGSFLYHPANTQRTNAVVAAAQRRRETGNVPPQSQALNLGPPLQRRDLTDLIPSSQPAPMHPMHNQIHAPMPPHPNLGPPRPEIQRSMSFPTPPSSASSVMGVGNSDGQPYWGGNMVSNVPGTTNQGLAIETVMNNSSRSLPTTPATTPPGGLQQMQQYPQSSSMYQNPAGAMQQPQQRYGQPLPQPSQYLGQTRDGNNMGPPPTQGRPVDRPSSRQDDHQAKEDGEEQNGVVGEHGDHGPHGDDEHETEGEHVQDVEYTTHDGSYGNGHGRPGVYYPPLQTDHSHISQDNSITDSPGHAQGPSTPGGRSYGTPNVNVPRTLESGSGSTPRTTTTPQQQWVQNSGGFSTPPRATTTNGGPVRQPPARGLTYQLAGSEASAENTEANGSTSEGSYVAQSGLGVTMPPQSTSQSYSGVNGSGGSNKRLRDMDEEEDSGSRPSSRGHDDRAGETDAGLKRRKTMRESSTPSTGMGSSAFDRNADGRLNRTRSAIGATGRVRR